MSDEEHRPTVLMVGQGEPMQTALGEALRRHGISVAGCATAELEQAVRVYAPDMVVLIGDAAIRGGENVVRRMAENRATDVLPVAVVSNDAVLKDEARDFRSGAVAVVSRGAGADSIARQLAEIADEVPRRPGFVTGSLDEGNLQRAARPRPRRNQDRHSDRSLSERRARGHAYRHRDRARLGATHRAHRRPLARGCRRRRAARVRVSRNQRRTTFDLALCCAAAKRGLEGLVWLAGGRPRFERASRRKTRDRAQLAGRSDRSSGLLDRGDSKDSGGRSAGRGVGLGGGRRPRRRLRPCDAEGPPASLGVDVGRALGGLLADVRVGCTSRTCHSSQAGCFP